MDWPTVKAAYKVACTQLMIDHLRLKKGLSKSKPGLTQKMVVLKKSCTRVLRFACTSTTKPFLSFAVGEYRLTTAPEVHFPPEHFQWCIWKVTILVDNTAEFEITDNLNLAQANLQQSRQELLEKKAAVWNDLNAKDHLKAKDAFQGPWRQRHNNSSSSSPWTRPDKQYKLFAVFVSTRRQSGYGRTNRQTDQRTDTPSCRVVVKTRSNIHRKRQYPTVLKNQSIGSDVRPDALYKTCFDLTAMKFLKYTWKIELTFLTDFQFY